jgi:AraC-like DNA-binding protein
MRLFIKYMVSKRCKLLVRTVLEDMEIPYKSVELGEVQLVEAITPEQRSILKRTLKKSGLELMEDKNAVLVNQVKDLIYNLLHLEEDMPHQNISEYLSQKMNLSYVSISHIFSETKGITIELYFLKQKIERVKEMLLYDHLSLTEIAYRLNYSSTAHLSAQFKKITGLTPSYFKSLNAKRAALNNS